MLFKKKHLLFKFKSICYLNNPPAPLPGLIGTDQRINYFGNTREIISVSEGNRLGWYQVNKHSKKHPPLPTVSLFSCSHSALLNCTIHTDKIKDNIKNRLI